LRVVNLSCQMFELELVC